MSMIVLAACQFLGRKVCLVLGAVIVLGHNALDGVWPAQQTFGDPATPLWIGLHVFFGKVMGPFFVFNAYPLLPWIGVMLLGFGAAVIFEKPAAAARARVVVVGHRHVRRVRVAARAGRVRRRQPLGKPGRRKLAHRARLSEYHASIRPACCSCS